MANVTGGLVPVAVLTVTLKFPSVALAAMPNVAVTWVELTVLILLTVMFGLLVATDVTDTKLLPVSVTETLLPGTPLLGLIEASVGAPTVTVNVTGALLPLVVVTITLAGPVVALAAMVNVAVICVGPVTLTPLTATPGLLTETVAPERKLAPVRVTVDTVAPWGPLVGLIELTLGAGGLTVNVTGGLVPLAVVTLTLAGPSAAIEAMVNVAVI
jgi:hypothetical protein